jgi:hypothetical protein
MRGVEGEAETSMETQTPDGSCTAGRPVGPYGHKPRTPQPRETRTGQPKGAVNESGGPRPSLSGRSARRGGARTRARPRTTVARGGGSRAAF